MSHAQDHYLDETITRLQDEIERLEADKGDLLAALRSSQKVFQKQGYVGPARETVDAAIAKVSK